MRVDDQVWTDAFLGEGHVLLAVGHSNSTLLAMSGGELITDLRDSYRSHLDLCEAVSVFVCGDNDLVNHTFFRVLELCRAVLPWLEYVRRLGTCISSELLSIFKHVLNVAHRRTLSDDDVVTVDNSTRIDDTIIVEFVVGAKPHVLSLAEVRPLEHLILVLRV